MRDIRTAAGSSPTWGATEKTISNVWIRADPNSALELAAIFGQLPEHRPSWRSVSVCRVPHLITDVTTIHNAAMGRRTSSIPRTRHCVALSASPATPHRKTVGVAERQYLVSLGHLLGDDSRLAIERDSRTLHLYLVLGHDLHILVLYVPTGA